MSVLYPVSDIFASIQGEGIMAGTPAIFIRLAGCNLSCPWCDTDHQMTCKLSIPQIRSELSNWKKFRNIVITGGEPTLHDLGPLLKMLIDKQCYVMLETNGTRDIPEQGLIDWITVSPKSKNLDPSVFYYAKEIKFIVENEGSFRFIEEILRRYETNGKISLQPIHGSDTALAIAIREAKERQWLLSIQVHRLIGIK